MACAGQQVDVVVELWDGTGQPVPWGDTLSYHNRRLHATIVSTDLAYVAHLHPEDFQEPTPSATLWSVPFTFPQEGTYIVEVEAVLPTNNIKDESTKMAVTGRTKPAKKTPQEQPQELFVSKSLLLHVGCTSVGQAFANAYDVEELPPETPIPFPSHARFHDSGVVAVPTEGKDRYVQAVQLAPGSQPAYQVQLLVGDHARWPHPPNATLFDYVAP